MTIEEQVETYIQKLEDKEINDLALYLKVAKVNEGIQAPLGVTVKQQQRENFIRWVKKTGNVEKAGIYLGILSDPDLPAREREAKRQRKLDQAAIDQAESAKSQIKIAWIALLVSIAALIISIITLCRK